MDQLKQNLSMSLKGVYIYLLDNVLEPVELDKFLVKKNALMKLSRAGVDLCLVRDAAGGPTILYDTIYNDVLKTVDTSNAYEKELISVWTYISLGASKLAYTELERIHEDRSIPHYDFVIMSLLQDIYNIYASTKIPETAIPKNTLQHFVTEIKECMNEAVAKGNVLIDRTTDKGDTIKSKDGKYSFEIMHDFI